MPDPWETRDERERRMWLEGRTLLVVGASVLFALLAVAWVLAR